MTNNLMKYREYLTIKEVGNIVIKDDTPPSIKKVIKERLSDLKKHQKKIS